jgi:DNA-3-methyladenine glycosylase II
MTRSSLGGQSRRPFTVVMRPVAPFRLDLTVWALRRRPRNAIDRWDGTTYRRVILLEDMPTELAVRQAGSIAAPNLIVTASPSPGTSAASRRMRSLVAQLLGIRIDLTDWYATAAHDARLGPLAERFRGMKPPRFPTVFEAVVNAFACQQLSLEVGLELLNRLAALCGVRAGTDSGLRFAFPPAQPIARLSPEQCQAIGLSRQKTHALLS